MDRIVISEIIKTRRRQLKVRQQHLSDMSGINIKTIYQIEHGKGNPSLDNILIILKILGLEVDIHPRKTAR